MYVRVHVVPGARRERVICTDAHVYTISVREPRERQEANRRVAEILAETYQCPRASIRLITGHRSPTKMYTIDK